ncbi:MAG TPA: 3-deoxy-D-manno-octulosonic acid transferase [Tepidisphaeraceae bacterium]|jgi:3-deoxy-D-manno-octulosonic-acid transferase|nr:3-deoxy-D-manno-octulosonic acid transferase [Tepidisphaeraceae bacterium]
MFNFYDIAYWMGLGAAAPYWLIKKSAREKVLRALRERMGNVARRESASAAVWIHAVSVGEINATGALIKGLRKEKPELEFIVSTTTTTGYARGEQLYGKSSHVRLIKYPLDFSSAIGRALDALRPSVVVLMELEIWPNFVLRCKQRGIPVIIVNGRITEPSFKKYMLLGPVTKRMLRRLDRICAQDETYAGRFISMGAMRETVEITGTMKFDTAEVADRVEGDSELAAAVGLKRGEGPIWVCGSTGPGEEEIVLGVYRELLAKHPGLRLAIIPRHPQRFDEVADLIRQSGFEVVRRSQVTTPVEPSGAVVLGDTMGELRKFYSLADVVFVGRSLVDLGARQHGSDMIEPAGLGKAAVVGPFTANFAEAMERLRAGKGIIEVADAAGLEREVGRLLSASVDAKGLGNRAQDVVREAKGATGRHVREILEIL